MSLKIQISGQHTEIGDALHTHVQEQLEKHVKKYFENAISAHVNFSKNNNSFKVHIDVNEGTSHGLSVHGNGQERDAYAAFDSAMRRIREQLARYKSRIKSHHKAGLSELTHDTLQNYEVKKYIFTPSEEEDEENGSVEPQDTPLIIAEKSLRLPFCSVSEAIMKMDLEHVPAKMFINKKTKSIGVVYHKPDGNIAWVDSGLHADSK